MEIVTRYTWLVMGENAEHELESGLDPDRDYTSITVWERDGNILRRWHAIIGHALGTIPEMPWEPKTKDDLLVAPVVRDWELEEEHEIPEGGDVEVVKQRFGAPLVCINDRRGRTVKVM